MLNKRILVLMFLVVFLPLVGCIPSPAPPIAENQAPVIISTPITTAKVGVAYAYYVEATDPDGDTLTYSLTITPSGMTINSTIGVISWNPNSAQVGNNAVTVKASDGTLSDTQSFTILVSKPCVPPCPPVNHAPLIASTPEDSAEVGVEYFYDVEATDPDDDVLTYSLLLEPDSMTIDPVTGLISWIPTTLQIGDNDVIVKVSDGGLIAVQSFVITAEAFPIVTSGYSGLTEAAGVRYKDGKGGKDIYLGIPDLGVGSNRVEEYYPGTAGSSWPDGLYEVTFSFDKDENKITTSIYNSVAGLKSIEYDFGLLLSPGCPTASWNTLDILVKDGLTTGAIVFNSVMLDAYPLGNFGTFDVGGAPGFLNWTVMGFDFSQSFTITGDLVVEGWTGGEANKLQIIVGCLP